MEELYAKFILWFHGFTTNEEYEALLHKAFLSSSNDDPIYDILLELEGCSSDLRETHGLFMRYWNYEAAALNSDVFGKILFAGLDKVYKSNNFSIADFGRRCYLLWRYLPLSVSEIEPFYALSYADDCLSWGDEKQTREIYENAFSFYNN